jgi:hypothetical protein
MMPYNRLSPSPHVTPHANFWHPTGVPAQQGSRGGDQAQLPKLAARQQPDQRGQHRPVRPRQPRGLDLTLKHGDLVAQDQDLGVLGAIGPGEQGKPAEHPQRREAGES